jgi:hypothetical protein
LIRFTDVLPVSVPQRTKRIGIRFVGAVAVTTALLATSGCQAEPEVSSPTDAALAYLEALADGDAGAANDLSKAASESYPLPADDSLDGAETITDIAAIEVLDYDSVLSDVPISYSLDGEKHETELSLVFVDGDWLISSGLEGYAAIKWAGYTDGINSWSDLNDVTVGTTTIEKYGALGVLYPGIYDVSPDLGPYVELVSKTITFVPESPGFPAIPMEIDVAPTAEVATEVHDALVKDLDANLARSDDEWPDIFYGDDGPGAWIYVKESLEGASVEWRVALPVKVEYWQSEKAVRFDATATINGSWKKGSKSGSITIPLSTYTLAQPRGAADTLDVLQTLWRIAD